MIGNDIVDLAQARKVSNWQRKGFLNKIFTQKEQFYIENAIDPELMVWNLWTRKEAAYKIFNRETGFRGFIPLRLECFYETDSLGSVTCNGSKYYTQTQISEEFIYTIAVAEKKYFNQIRHLTQETKIIKIDGVPFLNDSITLSLIPVSITHHGVFWEGITL